MKWENDLVAKREVLKCVESSIGKRNCGKLRRETKELADKWKNDLINQKKVLKSIRNEGKFNLILASKLNIVILIETSKAASIIAQASEKLRSELEERCKEKLIEEVKFFGDHYPEEFERTQTDQETEIEKAIWGAIKALELKCKQPLKGMLYEFWQKT